MSDTPEVYVRRRFERRADDNPWQKIMATLMRWRGVAAVMWTLFGVGITALLGRAFLVTQLHALDSRVTAGETQELLLAKTIEGMRLDLQVMTKSSCLDRTPAEQDAISIACPMNLYKGSLQGAPR